MAEEACKETEQSEPGFWLRRLRDTLRSDLEHYKSVLNEHGIPLPFDYAQLGSMTVGGTTK